MNYFFAGICKAFKIIFSLDGEFLTVVFTSVKISFLSTLLAVIFALPAGYFLAVGKFKGRGIILTVINTLMSLPTVVVGLLVYGFISRRGVLGELGLLYTLTAMVIGQFILCFPIICGLTVGALKSLNEKVHMTALSLGADKTQKFFMILKEARFALTAAVIAGFSRVFAEVGVSVMLGGNIKNYTRNITTAIALETSKGEFALAIALGTVLLAVSLTVNILFSRLQKNV
jgi:tungstate transport system permease protein